MNGGGRRDAINHVVWSDDGSRYAYCHGSRIVARDATTGEDLLDVDMSPCPRVNQVAFVGGPEGMFLAAACDDGGLPVLEVGHLPDGGGDDEDDDDDDEEGGGGKKASKKGKDDDEGTRRAIMAIEPVDGPVAGDDRFKCIRAVGGGSGFLVVTANSGGVVSVMDLEGAARMMLASPEEEDDDDEEEEEEEEEEGKEGRKKKRSSRDRRRGDDGDDESDDDESDDDESDDDDEEVEAAVEILDSVRIGSGARITDLAVWSHGGEIEDEFGDESESSSPDDDDDDVDDDDDDDGATPADDDDDGEDEEEEEKESVAETANVGGVAGKRAHQPAVATRRGGRGAFGDESRIELDPEAVERARKLVGQAKEHQRRKKRKLSKNS